MAGGLRPRRGGARRGAGAPCATRSRRATSRRRGRCSTRRSTTATARRSRWPSTALPGRRSAIRSSPTRASSRRARSDDVARVRHPRVHPWADAILARGRAARWLPGGTRRPTGPRCSRGSTRTRAPSRTSSRVAAVADLAAERARPVRLAIVGEFNAGKSTFINALIGADVAPTGVLPTTATLHHLRWAPDPIARISFAPGHEPPERIVAARPSCARRSRPLDAGLHPPRGAAHAAAVPRARRDPRHARASTRPTRATPRSRAARSRRPTSAIWLLDATQPMKQSERDGPRGGEAREAAGADARQQGRPPRRPRTSRAS